MTEQAPWEAEGPDGWAPFLEGTADRPPLPFFDQAIEFVGRSRGDERVAIDLGCGGGAETRALLDRGWSVFATDSSPSAERILRERVSEEDVDRLTIRIGSFEVLDLPDADLVFAQMSLPFAGPRLEAATANALSAVKAGGVFAGHFFGVNDDWIDGDNTAAVDRAWITDRFASMSELVIDETDTEGPYGLEGGTKHWHYYFVLARR